MVGEAHVQLVNRRGEIAWLRDRLRLAARGSPQCVLLSGDPGIGKTRLASELQADAERAGFLTLDGRGYQGVHLPYMTFREAIFPALTRVLASADVDLRALAIARGDEVDVPEADDAAASTRLLLELAELVYEGATQRPILLLLDDLQWADRSSLALVRHLAYRLSGGLKATCLYILVAARPSPAVAPLRLERRCAVLELAGLDPFESADLARRLGAPRVAPAELWKRTEGNPLLIEWSARRDGITPFETDWHLVFEERLRSLSPTAVAVLERAALLVPDLAIDALNRLGLWEPAAVVAAVDEAVTAGVLTSEDGEIRFAHPVLRDACVRALGPVATARAHAEIADALGPPEGRALITVARHLVLAGRQADADVVAGIAASAGHRAWGMCAWEEAAAFFEAALDAQDRCAHPASTTERAALHIGAGKCRQFALDVDGGLRHFERAAALARSAGDRVCETRARADRLFCLAASGPVHASDITTVEELATSIQAEDPATAAEALNDVSQAQWAAWRIGEARETIRRALEIADAFDLHGAACKAYVSRAITHWLTLDLLDALDDLQRADVRIQQSDDQWRRTSPAYRLPLTLLWLGRFSEARMATERAEGLCADVGSLFEYGLVLAARVGLALVRGDLVAADDDADRALRIQSLSGYRWAAGLILPALAYARLEHGDADGALAALSTWEESADAFASVYLDLLRKLVFVRSGMAGREVLERLPSLPTEPVLGAQDLAVIIVEIARALGEPDAALSAVVLLEATLERGLVVSTGLDVFLARATADGHALLGDTEPARRRYAEAVKLAETSGARAEAARARLGRARLEASRDRAVAAAELRGAMLLLDQLTLVPARAEAAALAEQIGIAGTREPATTSQPVPEQATVLFVDVVDSTRLTEELGDVEYRDRARALEQHLRLVVAERDGAAMPGINLGDGLLALFPSPRLAVDAAIAALDVARGGSLRLHLGLHYGTVLRERDATYGSTVNAAARICALTSPDEILVSETLHRTLTRASVPGLAFVDRGSHRLKGIAEEQQLFAVVPLA